MQNKPGKEEQIKAIVEGGCLDLVGKYLGPEATSGDLGQILTITKRDVRDYVNANGVPEFFYQQKGTADGVYLLNQGGNYQLYAQEHGGPIGAREFHSEEEMKRGIVDFLTDENALFGYQMKEQ